MPHFKKIKPSIESRQQLSMPITVVSRSIAANSVVDKHSHSWGQFVYANKGVLLVVTDTDRYIVPPEQGVWLLPGVAHEVSAISKVELTSFYFDNDLLGELPDKCCVLSVNFFLKTLIIEADSIAKNHLFSGSDDLLLKLILNRLSLAPDTIFQLPYPKDSRLLTMLSLIDNEPSNRYKLEQWGEKIGASSRTISRLFKKETGLNYTTWRQRLNIQIAISQLSKGMSITSISLCLGYESPSAFTHMFKENTGMTPSFYRDNK